MAQEVVLKVVATTKEAEENLQRLNDTLNEQNEILVELEKELIQVQRAQENLSKAAFSPERDKLAQIEKNLKNEIKDQRIALKGLNAERRTTKAALDSLTDAEVNQSKIRQGLDKVTGGYATKIKKLYLGFVESAKGVKLFVAGLSGLKKALIATGVGALVVALGTIIAYWDDIKGLINGVSSEQKKLLAQTKATRAEEEKQLELLNAQQNSLKLSGKSEQEIRDLKIQQTNEVIAATEALLLQQQEQKKAQVEAARRNKEITAGIIAFLTLPITLLLGAVDALTFGLKQIGVLTEATKLAEGYTEGLAGMLFDPEEVEEEGDKTIEATEQQLTKLRNQRDGYILATQDAEKKAAEEKDKERKRRDAEQRAYEEKVFADRLARLQNQLNKELNLRIQGEEKVGAIRRQFFEKNLGDSEAAELIRSQLERERVIREIQESSALQAQKDMAILEVSKFYDNEKLRIKAENIQKEKDLEEQQLNEKIAIIQAEQTAREENLATIANGLNGLQNVFKAFGKESKALAIAGIIVEQVASISRIVSNTGIANAKALAASPLTFGQPWVTINTVSAAASIAGSIASAGKSIAALKGNKKTPLTASMPTSPSGGGRGITAAAQAPQFNIIGGAPQNQLAGLLAEQGSQPVRAYVVSSEVSSGQALDRNIVESATLG